jgi:Xaa-Pro aminopeptidase
LTQPDRLAARHWSAVDVYGQNAVDWQERVDFGRLRDQRLERTRAAMREAGLSALLLFGGDNIRYATGAFQGHWKYPPFIRYCVVPAEGDPTLFELANIDLDNAVADLPWLNGEIRPAIAWRMTEAAAPEYLGRMVASVVDVLDSHGIRAERLGVDHREPELVDAFAARGYEAVDGQQAMMAARVIKLPDELELLKQACAIGDACFHQMKHTWLEPGIREQELVGEIARYLFANGFEHISQIFCASGGGTNPYRRWFSDKMMRAGDFVIVDLNAAGPAGYYIDYVRTLRVGGGTASREQRDSYRRCHELLQRTLAAMRPGVTTREVAEQLPVDDDDALRTVSLVSQAHSIGLSLADGRWISRGFSLDHPTVLEPNMYFAVETYAGDAAHGQAARLEDNVVITDTGCERFSLFEYEEDLLT